MLILSVYFRFLSFFIFQADVLEYYDQTVSSPSGSFYIPAVLRVGTHLSLVTYCIVFNCFNLNIEREDI
jgi:hypothetical protein